MINIDGKQIKLQIWDTVSQILACEKHLATSVVLHVQKTSMFSSLKSQLDCAYQSSLNDVQIKNLFS